MELQRYTLSVLVDNKYGALTRVTGLFARRAYNIESLTVGETHLKGISRITIVTEADSRIIDTIAKQVEKIADVRSVKIMGEKETIRREIMLVKVKVGKDMPKISEAVNVFRGNIVDLTPESAVVAIMGTSEKLNAFLEYAKIFKILEVSRTGLTVLERGATVL